MLGILALLLTGALSAAGAVSVTGPRAHEAASARARAVHQVRTQPVPKPSIRAKPATRTSQSSALFSFTDRQRRVTFQCSLDGSAFKSCSSPTRYGLIETKTSCPKHVKKPRHGKPKPCHPATKRSGTPLAPGRHTYRVRAKGRSGELSSPASYTWTIETQPSPVTPSPVTPPVTPPATPPVETGTSHSFSISTPAVGPLYPGAPPLTLPLTLHNPSGGPIYVTSLTVAVTSNPAGCDSATNVGLLQSTASTATPVVIPANGSVTLPAQGVSAPAIGLVDLPVNQDACKNGTFSLSYTGGAHS
jgi:hypothetical protein